jgi:hypothetical protein
MDLCFSGNECGSHSELLYNREWIKKYNKL